MHKELYYHPVQSLHPTLICHLHRLLVYHTKPAEVSTSNAEHVNVHIFSDWDGSPLTFRETEWKHRHASRSPAAFRGSESRNKHEGLETCRSRGSSLRCLIKFCTLLKVYTCNRCNTWKYILLLLHPVKPSFQGNKRINTALVSRRLTDRKQTRGMLGKY